MKIEHFTIPPEARRVSVEAEGNKIIIILEPEHCGDFLCKETNHIEEIPQNGDLAVFWDNDCREKAIIARLQDGDRINGELAYQASNEVWYENAIRFRSDDQFKLILKEQRYGKEAQSEIEA